LSSTEIPFDETTDANAVPSSVTVVRDRDKGKENEGWMEALIGRIILFLTMPLLVGK
jgi:hypothetical protein